MIASRKGQKLIDEENEPTHDDLPQVANIWGLTISFHFSGQGGLKNHAMNLTYVYEMTYFVTDEVLDLIVTKTNRYAAQFLASHEIRQRFTFRLWNSVETY